MFMYIYIYYRSANGLTAADCGSWLNDHPDLKSQEQIIYLSIQGYPYSMRLSRRLAENIKH